jgi:putative SOS response-associated peptidase YedK
MRWGLVPFWVKDIKAGFANINAKTEGVWGFLPNPSHAQHDMRHEDSCDPLVEREP